MTRSYIARDALVTCGQVVERSNMCTCKIFYMDVVAYASAVWGGKVITEYLKRGGMAENSLHHMRNEVLGEAPIFTQCCVVACASSIEISKTCMAHWCGLCIPAKSVFNHQFCFGVHAFTMQRVCFLDRHRCWSSIHRSSGRKDNSFNTGVV